VGERDEAVELCKGASLKKMGGWAAIGGTFPIGGFEEGKSADRTNANQGTLGRMQSPGCKGNGPF